MAVKRVADFQAKSVACAEPGRADLSRSSEQVPHAGGFFDGKVDFVAPFAGISGAAEGAGDLVQLRIGEPEVLQVGQGVAEGRLHQGAGGGALDIELGSPGGQVRELRLGRQMGLDPVKIGLEGPGIHYNKEVVAGAAKHSEIIDDAAIVT